MSKQQVKLSFDGSVRKVMMDVGSYELIQQSVSNVIGLSVGEFTVSYVDDDKDVISFPRTGVTKDEFDAFRSVEGPIRLIIERVVKSNQTSTTVKDDVTAPSSASNSTAASTSAAVEEEEEEPPKKEKSLCSLIGTILSNENIVHDVQSAIASKQVADIAALIGATLVAAGNNEQGCGFPSLLPILFTQAPVLLDILHQLSEKHPEIKELVETVKERGFSSFVHPRMYRKFFKICKRGGFGCHNEEQSDDNVEHHHHPHPHPPGHHHHHPDHHHGGHHHHPDHPPFHPPHHHPGHHGHHWPPHHHHGHHPDHPPFHPPHHHHPGHHHHHGGPDGDGFGRKSIHYGVTCDGCSSNNELKGKSLRDGHFAHHRGGFIAGNRYKSTSVHNFDLCESCEASGLFQQTHGPFIKIPNRVHGGWRRWSPFEQFERNVETTATSASSSSNSDEDDEVEQMYAQGASSSFEQKKNKGNEFDDIQKQGMDLFSSIMKAVSESSQPKKQNPDKDIDALAEKWKSKIELLQSLGFVEWKRYLPILEEENGDLERCIGRILALNDA